MRDTQLDIYRALLMMYIPCVVHVMYWLGDGREPYMSLLLVEMPLIFFLSGAALSVSKSRRGLWDTLLNRVKRVAAPYYIYAAVLLALGLIITILHATTGKSLLWPLDLTRYGWRDIAKVLLFQDIPQFPFIWHLWFIAPYLMLSCTFPIQAKLMEKADSRIYLAICIALFALAQCFTHLSLLRQVLCYNIFMVCGYLFYRKAGAVAIAATALAALAAVLVGTQALNLDFCPMQGHKFPPDWLFVAYSMFILCVIGLVMGRFTLKDNRIFKIWSERGYNIYLYQSVVFAVVHILRQKTYAGIPSPLVKALIDAAVVFILSTGLSCLTYPLEKYVMTKLKI